MELIFFYKSTVLVHYFFVNTGIDLGFDVMGSWGLDPTFNKEVWRMAYYNSCFFYYVDTFFGGTFDVFTIDFFYLFNKAVRKDNPSVYWGYAQTYYKWVRFTDLHYYSNLYIETYIQFFNSRMFTWKKPPYLSLSSSFWTFLDYWYNRVDLDVYKSQGKGLIYLYKFPYNFTHFDFNLMYYLFTLPFWFDFELNHKMELNTLLNSSDLWQYFLTGDAFTYNEQPWVFSGNYNWYIINTESFNKKFLNIDLWFQWLKYKKLNSLHFIVFDLNLNFLDPIFIKKENSKFFTDFFYFFEKNKGNSLSMIWYKFFFYNINIKFLLKFKGSFSYLLNLLLLFCFFFCIKSNIIYIYKYIYIFFFFILKNFMIVILFFKFIEIGTLNNLSYHFFIKYRDFFTLKYSDVYVFFFNFDLKKDLLFDHKFWLKNIEFLISFLLFVFFYTIINRLFVLLKSFYYYIFFILRYLNLLVISLWSFIELNFSDRLKDLNLLIVWFRWRIFLYKKNLLEDKIFFYFKSRAHHNKDLLYKLVSKFMSENKKLFYFSDLPYRKRFELNLKIFDFVEFINFVISWLFLDSLARKYNLNKNMFVQFLHFFFNLIFFSFFKSFINFFKIKKVTKLFTYANLKKNVYNFFYFFSIKHVNVKVSQNLNLLGIEKVVSFYNLNNLNFLRFSFDKVFSFFYYNFETFKLIEVYIKFIFYYIYSLFLFFYYMIFFYKKFYYNTFYVFLFFQFINKFIQLCSIVWEFLYFSFFDFIKFYISKFQYIIYFFILCVFLFNFNFNLNFYYFDFFYYLIFIFESICFFFEQVFFYKVVTVLSTLQFSLLRDNYFILFLFDKVYLIKFWTKLLYDFQSIYDTIFIFKIYGRFAEKEANYLFYNFFYLIIYDFFNKFVYKIPENFYFLLNFYFLFWDNIFHNYYLGVNFLVLSVYSFSLEHLNSFFYQNLLYVIFYFLLHLYFFIEFFFTKIFFIIIYFFYLIKYILIIHFLKYLINLFIFTFFYLNIFYNLFKFLYYYLFINLLMEYIYIFFYNIFFVKSFFNLYLFIYNFFFFYQEKIYEFLFINLNVVEHLNFRFDRDLHTLKYLQSLGVWKGFMVNETAWEADIFSQDYLKNLFLFELKNLTFFNSFYTFFLSISKTYIMLFIIYYYLLIRLWIFFFTVLSSWLYILVYNNKHSAKFFPHISWEYINYWENNEFNYYFNNGFYTLNHLDLSYYFLSYYNSVDKYISDSLSNSPFIFDNQLSDVWVDHTNKFNSKFISEKVTSNSTNNKFFFTSFNGIFSSLALNKNYNQFDFFFKSSFFLKNSQYLWFDALDKFLISSYTVRGTYRLPLLQELWSWPENLRKDNLNYLVMPQTSRESYINQNFFFSYYKPLLSNKYTNLDITDNTLVENVNFGGIYFLNNVKFYIKNRSSLSKTLNQPDYNYYNKIRLHYPFLFLFLTSSDINKHNKNIKKIFPFLIIDKDFINTYNSLYKNLKEKISLTNPTNLDDNLQSIFNNNLFFNYLVSLYSLPSFFSTKNYKGLFFSNISAFSSLSSSNNNWIYDLVRLKSTSLLYFKHNLQQIETYEFFFYKWLFNINKNYFKFYLNITTNGHLFEKISHVFLQENNVSMDHINKHKYFKLDTKDSPSVLRDIWFDVLTNYDSDALLYSNSKIFFSVSIINESYVYMNTFKFSFFLVFTFVPFFSFFLPQDQSMYNISAGNIVIGKLYCLDYIERVAVEYAIFGRFFEWIDDRWLFFSIFELELPKLLFSLFQFSSCLKYLEYQIPFLSITTFFSDHLLLPALTFDQQLDTDFVPLNRWELSTTDIDNYLEDDIYHFNNYGVTLTLFKDLFFVRPQFRTFTNSDLFLLKYSTNIFLDLFDNSSLFFDTNLFSKVFFDNELSDLFFFRRNYSYLNFYSNLLDNYKAFVVNFDVFSTYLRRFYHYLYNKQSYMGKVFYQLDFLKSYFYNLLYWDFFRARAYPRFFRKSTLSQDLSVSLYNLTYKLKIYNNRILLNLTKSQNLSQFVTIFFFGDMYDFTFFTGRRRNWYQWFRWRRIVRNDFFRFNEFFFSTEVPYVTTYLFFNSFSIDEFNVIWLDFNYSLISEFFFIVHDLHRSIIYFDNSFFYSNINSLIWNYDVIISLIDTGSFYVIFFKHYFFCFIYISFFLSFYFFIFFCIFTLYFIFIHNFFYILKKKYDINFGFFTIYFFNPLINKWEKKNLKYVCKKKNLCFSKKKEIRSSEQLFILKNNKLILVDKKKRVL